MKKPVFYILIASVFHFALVAMFYVILHVHESNLILQSGDVPTLGYAGPDDLLLGSCKLALAILRSPGSFLPVDFSELLEIAVSLINSILWGTIFVLLLAWVQANARRKRWRKCE